MLQGFMIRALGPPLSREWNSEIVPITPPSGNSASPRNRRFRGVKTAVVAQNGQYMSPETRRYQGSVCEGCAPKACEVFFQIPCECGMFSRI